MTDQRYLELKQMLESKRNKLVAELKVKVRDIADSGSAGESRRSVDLVDQAAHDSNNDLEFALINMKSDTIKKYDEALDRLIRGDYGCCSDCDDEISTKRLAALPFATRCINCQEARETDDALKYGKEAVNRRRSVFLDEP